MALGDIARKADTAAQEEFVQAVSRIRLGWGARKATHSVEYYVSDIWGHKSEAKGFGMDIDLERK